MTRLDPIRRSARLQHTIIIALSTISLTACVKGVERPTPFPDALPSDSQAEEPRAAGGDDACGANCQAEGAAAERAENDTPEREDAGAPQPAAPSAEPKWAGDRAGLRSLGFGALANGYLSAPQQRLGAVRAPYTPFHAEQYDAIHEPGFTLVSNNPLSTFSIDVDTASYSNVRRFLDQGALPPAGAVRIEELLNYFSYAYPQPSGEHPFSVTTEVAPAPWNPKHDLVLVGIQGKTLELEEVPPRNLVFLVDVSGSMMPPNKLPLVQRGLASLAGTMRPGDHVAIVVYAGASGCVLEPTSGANRQAVIDAIRRLRAGGSTNGAEGIRLAYDLARKHLDPRGVNRVILATDGDFNVGTTSRSELVSLIEKERESGVFLTVLGVGMGNLKDATMEELADRGNGNYAYLDSPAEARKVLVEEAGGTLVTIAKDVKIQAEMNPAKIVAYRLIGYENRRLRDEDFNDDHEDAGEVGAGRSVTAIYELVRVGREGADDGLPSIDPLRYQQRAETSTEAVGHELLTVKLRYKEPDGEQSKLVVRNVGDDEAEIAHASENLRFAAAVATFGMVLRQSEHRGSASFDMAQDLARNALGGDPNGYRAEFVRLVAMARGLQPVAAREDPVPDAFAGQR